jgi:hypothetical protein
MLYADDIIHGERRFEVPVERRHSGLNSYDAALGVQRSRRGHQKMYCQGNYGYKIQYLLKMIALLRGFF